MLKFSLEDHEVKIKFHHVTEDQIPLRNPAIPGARLGTICQVFEDDELYSMGVAYLHPKEQRDKNKGRKISMTRAIACFDREQRKMIWEKYFLVRGKVN